jgi:branched-chain amino acid transport system ATP-binding protein
MSSVSVSGTPAILALARVDTYYGDSHVLQDVTLAVEPGTITCLLGRNGAGKTTTVRTVMGLVPRSGQIRFQGQEITGAEPHRVARAGIALVPQGRGIFPDLTVRQQLTLAVRPGRWTLDRVYARFPILAERGTRPGGLLSGGEQQMLAIGRALLQGPSLLIMDEPTEGLAPLFVARVREILGELRSEGLSVLLVEQNLALAVADRIYIRNKGRVVFDGPPRRLLEEAGVRQYLGV